MHLDRPKRLYAHKVEAKVARGLLASCQVRRADYDDGPDKWPRDKQIACTWAGSIAITSTSDGRSTVSIKPSAYNITAGIEAIELEYQTGPWIKVILKIVDSQLVK